MKTIKFLHHGKKILFTPILFLGFCTIHSQVQTQVVGDSVLLHSNNGTTELNLENSTRNVNGFLFNKGAGRTEFRKGVVRLDDTTYLIGADTLRTTSPMIWDAANGLKRTGDIVKLGGDLTGFTPINLKDNRLVFYTSDDTYPSVTNGGLTISGAKSSYNGNDNLYIQAFNRPAGTFGGASVYAETFWNPTDIVSSGSFTNYISNHKSSQANINMSGMTLYDFRTVFHVNGPNQNYGNRYHFYVGGPAGYAPVMTNHVGLYVSPLKNSTTANAYAIYSAGSDDSIYHAGPVRWTRYKNGVAGDSVLSTDINGNLKLIAIQSLMVNLLPKLTTTQRDAIASNDLYSGLLFFNIDLNSFQYYSGSSWKTLSDQDAPIVNQSTLDFPSTSAGTSSDLNINIVGAIDGDVVNLGVPSSSVTSNTSFTTWVSATNTVTVRFNNYSNAAIDPASGNFKVKVIK